MKNNPVKVTHTASCVRSSRLYQNERFSHTPLRTLAPSTTGRMKIPSRKSAPTIREKRSLKRAMPRKMNIEAIT